MGIRSWDSAASTLEDNAMEVNPGISVQEHNYTYMFNFEQDFEHLAVRGWMEEHWRPVCCWASGVYMLLVVGGQAYMAERSPFQLRGLLTAWNIFLAVFFNHGRRQDPARIYLHNLDSGILSLFMHPLLHRTRPRFRILDLDVCSLKGARIRRYGVHRAKETATYLPSLVPSCNRPHLLLVLLHRIHGSSKMVRGDELCGSQHHVLLLCSQGHEVSTTKGSGHADYITAAFANGGRLHSQLPRVQI